MIARIDVRYIHGDRGHGSPSANVSRVCFTYATAKVQQNKEVTKPIETICKRILMIGNKKAPTLTSMGLPKNKDTKRYMKNYSENT